MSVGPNLPLHKLSKPAIWVLYYLQARNYIKSNQMHPLSVEILMMFESYLGYKYISSATQVMILEHLCSRLQVLEPDACFHAMEMICQLSPTLVQLAKSSQKPLIRQATSLILHGIVFEKLRNSDATRNLSQDMENVKRFKTFLHPGPKRDAAKLQWAYHMLAVGLSRSSPDWHSVLTKHLKTLANTVYSAQEREVYRGIIFRNVIQNMRDVLDAISVLGLELSPKNAALRDTILRSPTQIEAQVLPQNITTAIRDLWTDSAVKESVRRGREFQLSDGAAYFFNSINRISLADYIPTDQDISHAYVKQQGIEETSFWVGDSNLVYKIYNLSAQRSEQRNWLHCYENIKAIIFYVDLGDYDRFSYEDERVNCIQEALTLFESVCNTWFVKTSIILFLGTDTFAEKLARSPLSDFFPDYEGGTDYDAACDYLLYRFVSLNQNAERNQIYAHFATLGDLGLLKFLMSAVQDISLKLYLKETGLL